MPRPRFAVLVTLLAGALLLAGCSGADSSRTPVAEPVATSIAQLDPAAMHLVRVAFCDLVPTVGVTRALGGTATSAETWGNGEPIPVVAGTEVAHEFGCSWSGPKRRTAQTWVFARPVDAAFARRLISSQAAAGGCITSQDGRFGTPAVTQVCKLAGGTTRVRHAGLFGNTWLTCQVTGRSSTTYDVRRSSDTWCAGVATALDTGR
ncbi:MAG: hypothetical protein JWQ74_1319 [Marmoricola sp.]|nr:hypothetical protein [Marmoricola sp.]